MPFMAGTRSWLDELRIRASYGVTGRNAGSDYASLSTYASKGSQYMMDGEWVPGYGINRNANPNLGWETAVVYDYGVDFEFLNHRLSGSLEYFDRRSENLLYTYTAPQPPYVYSTIQLNLGSTSNKGVELALTWRDNISASVTTSTRLPGSTSAPPAASVPPIPVSVCMKTPASVPCAASSMPATPMTASSSTKPPTAAPPPRPV